MNEYVAQLRQRASEQRRSALQNALSDVHGSSGGEKAETGLEQPGAHTAADKSALDEEAMSFEDPVTAITLSDEELKSVVGGMGVPADAPSKLREATCCYLADATSDEAFATLT